jgi:hypothetical protein
MNGDDTLSNPPDGSLSGDEIEARATAFTAALAQMQEVPEEADRIDAIVDATENQASPRQDQVSARQVSYGPQVPGDGGGSGPALGWIRDVSHSFGVSGVAWRPSGPCSLFACDIVSFGHTSRTDQVQTHLRTVLFSRLRDSFDDGGIGYDRCYAEDRGDGAVIVVPPDADVALLITSVVDRLHTEVRRYNDLSSEAAQMRLRVAVHTGEVDWDGGLVGAAVNYVFRLLDAAPFKDALRSSGSGLALIVSARVHEDLVRSGLGLVDPSDYRQVEVQVKEAKTTAWFRIPGERPLGTSGSYGPQVPAYSGSYALERTAELSVPSPAQSVTREGSGGRTRSRPDQATGDQSSHDLKAELERHNRWMEREENDVPAIPPSVPKPPGPDPHTSIGADVALGEGRVDLTDPPRFTPSSASRRRVEQEMIPPGSPLILSEQAMTSLLVRRPVPPGRALLFATTTGDIVQLSKPPGLFTARRYRWRYEIDISDHYETLNEEVPSASGASFLLSVDVGWRVSDPAQIVQRRILDGASIVRSRLLEAIRSITRSYLITDVGPAEQTINSAFGGRDQVYPEGITVFWLTARVSWDELETARQIRSRQQVHHTELERQRVAELRSYIRSEEDLVFLFLARHPDQVHTVIDDIRQRREMTEQARLDLFNRLVLNGLVQEADVESVRPLLMRPVEDITSPLFTTSSARSAQP